jgi:hypothetical protein
LLTVHVEENKRNTGKAINILKHELTRAFSKLAGDRTEKSSVFKFFFLEKIINKTLLFK